MPKNKRNIANSLHLGELQGYDPGKNSEQFTYDPKKARLPEQFMAEYLTHVKGPKAGQPFTLEPWEQWFIRNLFGWVRKDDGTRRYREGMIFVPRGNGKTTLAAAIQLYVTACDNEAGAENYCAAAEAQQARMVFDACKFMIKANPHLRERLQIFQHSITYDSMGTCFRPISSVPLTKHGFNVHAAVIDELHAQKDRQLVDAIRTGTGKRLQPLVIYITTSDFDRPSICNEMYDYACKVRDGLIDDSAFLPLIYEADREDDWTSKKTWHKANPNLGVSVPLQYMERECLKAQSEPEYENTFKRYHLNIKTEQAKRIVVMEEWDACNGLTPVEELEGRPCYGGLDLATRLDVNAFVLVFPDDSDLVNYDVLCRFWVPADNAVRRFKRDGVPYTGWGKDGHIEMTPGNSADHRVIRQRIVEDCDRFNVQQVGFDPFNAAKIVIELSEEDGVEMVQFRQGMLSMGPPTKEMLHLIHSGRFRHGGNPVLRWMASNLAAREDHAQNIMPDRKKSSEKIDGIVALVMAVGLAIKSEPVGPSIYETEDLVIV